MVALASFFNYFLVREIRRCRKSRRDAKDNRYKKDISFSVCHVYRYKAKAESKRKAHTIDRCMTQQEKQEEWQRAGVLTIFGFRRDKRKQGIIRPRCRNPHYNPYEAVIWVK